MRFDTPSVLASLGLLLSASTVLAAGTVQVSYVQPDRFADVGRAEREDNLKALSKHFEALASRLADGQKLNIEVLDVDLAGEVRRSRRAGQDVRVLRGGADWPRIALRYTLESAGQAVRHGENKLTDLAYAQRAADSRSGEALHAEKRMLDAWFATEFGAGAAK